MNYEALLEKGKSLQITDERNIFAKVIVSYSTFYKIMNIFLFRRTQGAGRLGFIGVYQDQFVYYDSQTWKSVPGRERLRVSLIQIEQTSLKKKIFNYRFIVKVSNRKYKFYCRKRDIDIMKEMKKQIDINQKASAK